MKLISIVFLLISYFILIAVIDFPKIINFIIKFYVFFFRFFKENVVFINFIQSLIVQFITKNNKHILMTLNI